MRSVWNDEADFSERLWRYFKTSHFLSFIKKASLHFAPVAHFADRFEGAAAVIPLRSIDPRYAELDHADKAFGTMKNDTNVCCWHRAEYESEAMWRLYAEESKGVVVCTTLERMRTAIAPFYFPQAREPESLWVGSVRYVDLAQERIKDFGIKRFFYKHVVFASEREFRLALNLEFARLFNGISAPEGVFVSVNLTSLVEQVILGPLLSPDERAQISEHIHDAGLGDRLVDSILLGQVRYI